MIKILLLAILAISAYGQEFTNTQSQYIDENLLLQPGFENGKSNWTSGSGTTALENSVVIKGKYSLKIVSSTQTLSLVQSSSKYAAQFADGVQGLAAIRVKTDHTGTCSVCSVQAGTVSTTNCATVSASNKWGYYSVPMILGATSNGISLACTSGSGTTYVDDAYVGAADPFVSAPLITEWVDFPSVAAGTLITATTTNPAYGTVVNNKAQWRRVGSNMEIRWDYRQTATTGAASGSGNYLFNLPPGYEIDTTKVKANTSLGDTASAGNDSSSIGTIWGAYSTTGIFRGAMSVYSSTKLKGYVAFGATAIDTTYWGAVSPVSFLSFAGLSVSMSVSVPILGWSSSINTITQQCQNDVECANEFSAVISDTGSITAKNLDWISSCTKSGTSNYITTCTFNSGIFTTAPTCAPAAVRSASSGGFSTNLVSTSSTQVVYYTGGGSSSVSNDPVHLICQKQGTDYKARRAIVGSFNNIEKLRTATGEAPSYSARSWVNFDGVNAGTFAGGTSTVSRTSGSTTATITTTNPHGLITDNAVWALTGVVAGHYLVTVTSATTFTITTVATTVLSSAAITFSFATVRANGNISSVTDNGTGDYTVNFSTAMIDANYAVVCTSESESANPTHLRTASVYYNSRTTSSVRLRSGGVSASTDFINAFGVFVTIFR